MNIVVTGWNGRVGRVFFQFLKSKESPEIRVISAGKSNSDIQYSLQDGFNHTDYHLVENSHIVHAAFSWTDLEDQDNINVQSVRYLLLLTRQLNAGFTLISSHSADLNSLSWYSRTKARQELLLDGHKQAEVLRIGIAQYPTISFIKFYSLLPVLVLPRSNRKYFLTDMRLLVRDWYSSLELERSKALMLAEGRSFSEIILQLKSQSNRRHVLGTIFLDFGRFIPLLLFIRSKMRFAKNGIDSILFFIEK